MDITTQHQLRAVLGPENRVQGFTSEAPAATSFAEALKESLVEVNDRQIQANAAAAALVTGRGGALHDVMIQMKEAQVSFELVLAVRNKVIEAYQEVMRMQV
ncbi:MAG TPA: flagellar hook-basal body complex protein FliE [bacterium]|jgi:flagellar hook-basal body complex protein FliE